MNIGDVEVGPGDHISHVHALLWSIAKAPSAIAPERSEELQMLLKEHNIAIECRNNDGLTFKMGAMYGTIFTPMRVYQHLWSAALFYSALFFEREKAVENGKFEVDLTDPGMEKIFVYYKNSCDCLRESREFLVAPNAECLTNQSERVILADSLFVSMVAFCLLHEIAHLKNGDSKTDDEGQSENKDDPKEIEFAADKWAYDWMLKDCWHESSNVKDAQVFIRRSFGVIFSLTQMFEFKHHENVDFSNSHPDACERLLRFFDDYEVEFSSNPWVASALSAVYVGLQGSALVNGYLLPHEGFSDPASFVKLVQNHWQKGQG